jgi:hypothetical protein
VRPLIEILETLSTDMSENIPAILTSQGVSDFEEYVIGPSRDAKQRSLCLYINDVSRAVDMNRLAITVQAQLYAVSHEDAIKYAQAVLDYIAGYDVASIGMTDISELALDVYPPDKNRTVFAFIDAVFTEQKDSCDGGI